MIILSLIHQELLRQHQHAALVHWKGLAKMVELRGGLYGLQANMTLTLKIAK
jgi:hypothetical protein